jgi:hypothetical protein
MESFNLLIILHLPYGPRLDDAGGPSRRAEQPARATEEVGRPARVEMGNREETMRSEVGERLFSGESKVRGVLKNYPSDIYFQTEGVVEIRLTHFISKIIF